MSRWWRAYDEAVDDPKLILLSDKAHRAWFNLMCVSSAYGGTLPDVKIIAVKLRVTPQQASAVIAELVVAELLDRRDDGGFEPHNWNARQYKSDVSTERVKRFRKQQRNVSVTPPETETETETEKTSEAIAPGAEAPIDHRKRLFDEGLPKLAKMTGKGPDSCRAFVGKCLKASGDDAIVVLGLIDDAERNQAVDPSAYILARLKGPQNGNGTGQTRTDTAAGRAQARETEIVASMGRAALRLRENRTSAGQPGSVSEHADSAKGRDADGRGTLLDLEARCGSR